MKMSLREVLACARVERVVVRSLDHCVYTAGIVADGTEYVLTDGKGRSLRTRNLLEMRTLLAPLAAYPAVLRQDSAYDEMVGQPRDRVPNALEVPLALAGVPGDITR